MSIRQHRVWYTCHDCSAPFCLMQGDPEPDEDVCICWACIDRMFGPGKAQ